AANIALLRSLIDAEPKPGDDFRAGFDGILGGYLVATGDSGIAYLSQRYFQNPRAAIGDVRHAHSAMRFYHEFGPVKHRTQVAKSVRELVSRPSVAAAALADLSRWEDWSLVDKAAGLFNQNGFDTPDVRRAI